MLLVEKNFETHTGQHNRARSFSPSHAVDILFVRRNRLSLKLALLLASYLTLSGIAAAGEDTAIPGAQRGSGAPFFPALTAAVSRTPATTNPVVLPPRSLIEIGAIQVAAGSAHALAVAADGTVWAWGRNANGQLGDGTTVNRYAPVQVIGLSGVVSVSAGSGHSLALKADGTVWAWGVNFYGQRGDGILLDRLLPVRLQAWPALWRFPPAPTTASH